MTKLVFSKLSIPPSSPANTVSGPTKIYADPWPFDTEERLQAYLKAEADGKADEFEFTAREAALIEAVGKIMPNDSSATRDD